MWSVIQVNQFAVWQGNVWMETVIPPFLGHGHSRVMSWAVEEAPEFFQTSQAAVRHSPEEGPGGTLWPGCTVA